MYVGVSRKYTPHLDLDQETIIDSRSINPSLDLRQADNSISILSVNFLILVQVPVIVQ